MRFIDDVVLALLNEALPPFETRERVHDGDVPVADPGSKIITADLPYLAYLSNLGADSNRRLSGQNGRRSMFFQVTYVGDSRDQAKRAGEAQRARLADQVLPIPGRHSWRCLLDPDGSQRIRRDDDAVHVTGAPLFVGVDLYSVAVTRIPGE